MPGKTKMYASGPIILGFKEFVPQCPFFIQSVYENLFAEYERRVKTRRVPQDQLFEVSRSVNPNVLFPS